VSETWEVSADLNMHDYWREAIGGSWTPVKYSKHMSWHPTTIKAEIDAHRTEPVADCLVGLVFSLAIVRDREDMAWRTVQAKDAEIASLRAQLDEAKEAVKFASESVAGLARTAADLRSELDEARRKAIEQCAAIAKTYGGDCDLMISEFRALLSESKT